MVKKHYKSSSPEPEGMLYWDLVCSIGAYHVCSNDDPKLTLTYLTSMSNLLSNAFKYKIVLKK